MMRKALSILLTIVFLFTVASPCFASQPSDSEIDVTLIERGYPAEVLEHLCFLKSQRSIMVC